FFLYLVFFFSSRRRHTRCYRDWSSDVCSSDLAIGSISGGVMLEIDPMADWLALFSALLGGGVAAGVLFYLVGRRVERRTAEAARSEERRVGKEGGRRWGREDCMKHGG